ncbi:MAG: tetratricopeptide repeat protein [Bdellovibrionota bacterium]
MTIEDAKKLLAQGHTAAAKDLLMDLDHGGQSTAELQYLLGTIFHRENKFAEAVDRFKRSLQIDPHFTDAAISLSIIYNDTGHYQEGKQVFEQAEKAAMHKSLVPTPSIVLARETSTKHLELGNLYRRLQRFDEAANEFLKASRVDPENFDARILLAKTHGQRGQMNQARVELEKLVREHPEHVPARIHLALLYYALGNTVDAQIELHEAQLKDPNNEQVRMYIEMTRQATESTI